MDQNHSKPYLESRPWGNFVEFVKNQPCTVKILTIKKDEAFSLQYHELRDESWRILSGKGFVTIGQEIKEIVVAEDYFVPSKSLHRIEATDEDVVVLEIALVYIVSSKRIHLLYCVAHILSTRIL